MDVREAVCEAPDDDAARLAYAELLDRRGDPRGELVRIEIELARLKPRLETLRRSLDGDWVAAVTRHVALVLVRATNDRKIMTIRSVRMASGLGLREALELVERVIAGRPEVVCERLEIDEAERLERLFDGIAEVRVEERPQRVSSPTVG